MSTESSANIESLANKAVYYWEYYSLHGHVDNLSAAFAFMQDYRKCGGVGHVSAWEAIQAEVAKLASIPHDCAANGAVTISRNNGPTVNDEQRECSACGHSVVHDLVDAPFWGFRANCPHRKSLPK